MDECDRIVDQHGQAVWQTICRLLGSQDGAADCFQETFLQYIRIAANTDVKNSLALLRRIATRRAIDSIRKQAMFRRRQMPLDEQRPGLEGEAWKGLAAEEFAQNLRDALQQISPAQATAFCMTQLEQMGTAEVASAMGIDARHVAVLLHRARATLQGLLAKHLSAVGRRS